MEKKRYLYEMHSHTAPVSTCAQVQPEVSAKMHKEAGYTGLVITNHFSDSTFDCMVKAPWEEKIAYFLSGYQKAKALEDEHFHVLLGMEIRFYEGWNDYLVYGIDENFLLNNGDLMALNPEKFHALAEKNGLLVYQAHPFRVGMQVVSPRFLNGVEGCNGNARHNSNNDIAAAWAKKFNFPMVAGSDFHNPEDVGRAGVWFDHEIVDNAGLLEALKGEYTLKTPDGEMNCR